MKRFLSIAALLTALSLPAGAQCVMCYRTAHAQQCLGAGPLQRN